MIFDVYFICLGSSQIFRLDLIPVSSTVIPLHEFTVTSHGNNTEQHPKMMSRQEIKRFLKKYQINEENPHELITGWFFESFTSVKSSKLNTNFHFI